MGDSPPRLAAVRDVAQILLTLDPPMDEVLRFARRWRAEAVLARGITMAWDLLAPAATPPLVDWAGSYQPSRVDRLLLASQTGPGRGSTRHLAALLVIPGLSDRVAYLRAVAWPHADYLRSRGLDRRDHLRRAVGRLHPRVTAHRAPQSQPPGTGTIGSTGSVDRRRSFPTPPMNQLASRTSTSRPSLAPMVGLVVVGVVLLVGAQRLGHLNSEELGALITVAVLLALTIPIAVVLGRLDKDPRLTTLLLAAFVAKMIGAYVRYTVLYDVYEGLGDAARYYDVGLQLADQFKDGNYVFGEVSGSRFIEILSGMAYTVLPRSQLAGFVLFSWVAFLGLILFSRAIRIALPDADHRRYDLLLFFLPTLVFWPSSIGKEAWMVSVLGLASYGAARLFTHRVSGLVPLGLGLWGASVVRPHMALMILAALGPAWLVRPSGRNRLGLSPFFRAIGFAALIVVLLAVVSQAETFFGIERLDAEGAEDVATNNRDPDRSGGLEVRGDASGLPADIPSPPSPSCSGHSSGKRATPRGWSPRPRAWSCSA